MSITIISVSKNATLIKKERNEKDENSEKIL